MKDCPLPVIAECVLLKWKSQLNQSHLVTMPAAEGMNIKTNTESVEKSKKRSNGIFVSKSPRLSVCDQVENVIYKDQSLYYGVDKSRFSENKRFVSEKYMGPLIKTQMTRCIHCTRCKDLQPR